jgi:hypothetical protein
MSRFLSGQDDNAFKIGSGLSLSSNNTISVNNNQTIQNLTISGTEDATSITTGSLQLKGGASITKSVYLGSNISFPGGSAAAPSVTSRSAGTRVIIYPEISTPGYSDYALGVESHHMWYSGARPNSGHKWYAADNNIMTANALGLTVFATTDSTSLTTGALQVRGGCAIQKNLQVGSNITLSGEVTPMIGWGTSSTAIGLATGVAQFANNSVIGDLVFRATNANMRFTVNTFTVPSNLDLLSTGVIKVNTTADTTSVSTGALQCAGGVSSTKNLVTGQRVLIRKGATNNYASIGYEADGTTFTIKTIKADGTSITALTILEDGTLQAAGGRVL